MLNNLKEKEWVYLITSEFIGRKSIQKITRNKMYTTNKMHTTIEAEICGKLERMVFIVETKNQQQVTTVQKRKIFSNKEKFEKFVATRKKIKMSQAYKIFKLSSKRW